MKMTAAEKRRALACTGKHRFTTFARASRVAHRQAQRREGHFEPYHCPDCGGFHVGSHFNSGEARKFGSIPLQPFIVFARRPDGREIIVGRSPDALGGQLPLVIAQQPGWSITRIVPHEALRT
ncbi:MAG TPA: hypothetical protein VGG49_02375 [Steroidobacteraceae bacterium]|jgi:hypothetical protein